MPSIRRILRKFLKIQDIRPSDRRLLLSKSISDDFLSVIRYGPFKGVRLSEKTWWGEADRATKLLGIYEQEVLDCLQKASTSYSHFIDVGAADGYYAIGTLFSGMFEKVTCYEISETGRAIISANATTHHVDHNIKIYGVAEAGFWSVLSQDEIDQSVLLMDIEGGEFDLLTEGAFEAFRKSKIIVELHEWVDKSGQGVEKILKSSEKTHTHYFFTTGARDLSLFPELEKLSDDDRWLICSEGRPKRMNWVCFEPLYLDK